jgi:ribonuclease P protein component
LLAQDFGFPAQYRLRTPADYQKVFSDPVKSSDKYFTVLAKVSSQPQARLGLAIAKKSIKTAVARNRIKRTVRESFRLQRQQIANIDVVVLARREAAEAPLEILRRSLTRHWLKLADRCEACS